MVLCQTAFQTPIVIVGLLECLLSLTDSNNLAYLGNSALDMGIYDGPTRLRIVVGNNEIPPQSQVWIR
ncbi:CIC11C00000003914 [Sungouiella intermedia]|uniref:CIC11C00000003914 n=1 Tax=Sungouiella intermedia TaxID=45354 RepID=A0A1L0DPV1_9ASCO|nr:CIC11C00000003914 [[Candida] intermedia]